MKIYLLFNGQRIAKKKTHVKKRTLNPVFNESFVFELPHMEEGLKNISLEFMLLDWDRVTKNEVIFCLLQDSTNCTVGKIYTLIFSFFRKRVVNITISELGLVILHSKYLSNEIRKNLHPCLTDQFQTLMGTSGHHNGHFDIK